MGAAGCAPVLGASLKKGKGESVFFPPCNHFSYVFDTFEITSICNSSAQAQAAPPHSRWDGGDREDIGTT